MGLTICKDGWERHHGTDLILVFWFWRKHRETWNPQISWTCQMFPKRSLLVISQGWGCLSNPCWWWCQAASVWRQIWQTDLNPSVTSEAFNVFLGLQKCPHWLQFFPGWYIRHDCHLRKAQVRTSSAMSISPNINHGKTWVDQLWLFIKGGYPPNSE